MKGSRDYYRHGDQNAICDRCGFKFKLSELMKTWDGYMVDSLCFEPRHPRDFPPPTPTEKPPKEALSPVTPTYTDVTYATSPTVPTGTFSGSHSAEE